MTRSNKRCECGAPMTFYAKACQSCTATPMPQRFWWKVQWSPGCWLWTASKDGKGYGKFKYEGRDKRAHIVAFLLTGGRIPDGMMLDHLCRTPACVNPTHLEVVDNRTNVLRGSVTLRGERPTCRQGHLYPENPRRASDGSRVCLVCMSAHQRRWAANNPERVRQAKSAYRARKAA